MDGSSILNDCKGHGIDISQIRVVAEASTSFSDVMTAEETGIRTSFNHAGANAELRAEDFNFKDETSRIFFLGTLFFLASLDAKDSRHGSKAASVLASARRQGILTCIDIERTNPSSKFQTEARAALHETDLAIFNVEVAEMLTGVRIRYAAGVEMSAAEEAASKLLAFGHGECAVIRYPAGALALSKNGEKVLEGSVRLPKVRIRSAAGSGHAFTAGFLHEYHEQRPLSACLRAAHSCAAACLMDSSTSGGIKSMDACLHLLEEYGKRENDRGG